MEDGTAELYQKHAADLLRLSTMLVGPGDADDVFTEAVLNATRSRKWSGLDDDARGAYLYRTLVNQARQWGRSIAIIGGVVALVIAATGGDDAGIVVTDGQDTSVSEDDQDVSAGEAVSVLDLAWVEVPLDAATFGDTAQLLAVAASDSMVVVGGAVGDDAAIWSSTDRLTWTRVPNDAGIFGGDGQVTVEAIVPWGWFRRRRRETYVRSAGAVASGRSSSSHTYSASQSMLTTDPARLASNASRRRWRGPPMLMGSPSSSTPMPPKTRTTTCRFGRS